jgi:hypothetical protein
LTQPVMTLLVERANRLLNPTQSLLDIFHGGCKGKAQISFLTEFNARHHSHMKVLQENPGDLSFSRMCRPEC